MNKTIVSALIGLIFLLEFTSCISLDSANGNSDGIIFSAQYIRTDEYHTDSPYPVITVVSSQNDLEKLYTEKYDLSAYPYLAPNIDFDNAMKNYSENYFQNNFLVIIVLEEGSGSIRHSIEDISSDGTIFINRIIPEIGTADMAKWSIILELENSMSAKNFTIQIIDER